MLMCWLPDDADVSWSCVQQYPQAITPNQRIIIIIIIIMLCQSALLCQHNTSPDVYKFSEPTPML